MFDGTEVTLTNKFIIITPVQLTIYFIMKENVQSVVVTPLIAMNPVGKALEWIRFGTEGNRNSICDLCGLEELNDFYGLTERNI